MTAMDFLEEMGNIHNSYIVAAHSPSQQKKFRKSLLIAAILAAFLLAACAAAGSWFVGFFQARGPISEGQLQYINRRTEDQHQAKYQGQCKIEMVSSFGDSKETHIVFRITGPQNLNLEQMGAELFFTVRAEGPDGHPTGLTYWVEPDQDGRSNTQTMVLILKTEGTQNWTIHISDLYGVERDTEYEQYLMDTKYIDQTDIMFSAEEAEKISRKILLANGPWDFDLNLEKNDLRELELLDAPIRAKMPMKQAGKPDSMEETELISIKLFPMGAELICKISEVPAVDFEMTVILKDGTAIGMSPYKYHPQSGVLNLRANNPILLDQVEKVVLPDGTEIQNQAFPR